MRTLHRHLQVAGILALLAASPAVADPVELVMKGSISDLAEASGDFAIGDPIEVTVRYDPGSVLQEGRSGNNRYFMFSQGSVAYSVTVGSLSFSQTLDPFRPQDAGPMLRILRGDTEMDPTDSFQILSPHYAPDPPAGWPLACEGPNFGDSYGFAFHLSIHGDFFTQASASYLPQYRSDVLKEVDILPDEQCAIQICRAVYGDVWPGAGFKFRVETLQIRGGSVPTTKTSFGSVKAHYR